MLTDKLSTIDKMGSMRKNIILYENPYGKIAIPSIPHKDRAYGGHLMVSPCHKVHHMHELLQYPGAFLGYHLLCMLAENAMLEVVESLNEGKGVINLFEAGNWQLHRDRNPVGEEKNASYKTVHAHLYGRSPLEPGTNEYERQLHWEWGEAPDFPAFRDSPFSPPQEKKNWVIPEQFNDAEIDALKNHIVQHTQRIDWEKLVEAESLFLMGRE